MQDHYKLLNREEEREMLPLCADQGIGVIKVSHVDDALAAVDVSLTDKDLARLAEPCQPHHPAGF